MQEGPGRIISDSKPASKWRGIADQHHAALLADLTSAVDAQLSEAVTAAVTEERRLGDARTDAAKTQTREETLERTRRSVSDSLNQTLRRLRQVPSQAGVLKLLVEASSPWAKSAAILVIEAAEARPLASRNPELENLPPAIALDDAAAINAVVETTDPITAIASPSELGESLSATFGPETKCHLFPVSVRGSVSAVFIATGELVTGALELLTEAAGMRLEALEPAVPPALKPLDAPGLIQISAASPAAASPATASPAASSPAASSPATAEKPTAPPPLRWQDLSAADQKLHLHAQRIARVKVAEFRLYHSEALRQGVFAGNIYNSLREQIDQARTDFQNNCMAKSSNMVDYLHLEILRSLAHDDERLLGSEYPGPLA